MVRTTIAQWDLNMINRLKRSLILTPAIFMPLIWVLFLSDSPMLHVKSIYELVGYALLISFCSAYLITLYISYNK